MILLQMLLALHGQGLPVLRLQKLLAALLKYDFLLHIEFSILIIRTILILTSTLSSLHSVCLSFLVALTGLLSIISIIFVIAHIHLIILTGQLSGVFVVASPCGLAHFSGENILR
jgi:hypothetical protein